MAHRNIVWINQDIQDQINHHWFQPQFWKDKNAILGSSQGRSSTYFVQQKTTNNGFYVITIEVVGLLDLVKIITFFLMKKVHGRSLNSNY